MLKTLLLSVGLYTNLIPDTKTEKIVENLFFENLKLLSKEFELKEKNEVFYENIFCLSLNSYFEARNSSFDDKLAVSFVVKNRKDNDKFPNTICEVIKEKNQFSWYGKRKLFLNNKRERKAYIDSIKAAFFVENNIKKDITRNSLFYHSKKVNPHWRKNLRVKYITRHHVFYGYGIAVKYMGKKGKFLPKIIKRSNMKNR